jgi:hypothetical protein
VVLEGVVRTASVSISVNWRDDGRAATVNWKAYPALRKGAPSAPARVRARLTETGSPAEKAAAGVSVTVRSPLLKAMGPDARPLQRPTTRKLAAVTEARWTARSNVTLTVVSSDTWPW